MTKKDFIAKYNNKLFKRVVMEGPTLEDLDTMRANLKELADNSGLELTEDDNSFKIANRVWFKPKMPKEMTVRIKFNSTQYDVLDEAGERISGDIIPAAQYFSTGGMELGDAILYQPLDKN